MHWSHRARESIKLIKGWSCSLSRLECSPLIRRKLILRKNPRPLRKRSLILRHRRKKMRRKTRRRIATNSRLVRVTMKVPPNPFPRLTSTRSRSWSLSKTKRSKHSKNKSSNTKRSSYISWQRTITRSSDTRRRSTRRESSPSRSLRRTCSMSGTTCRWAMTSARRSN